MRTWMLVRRGASRAAAPCLVVALLAAGCKRDAPAPPSPSGPLRAQAAGAVAAPAPPAADAAADARLAALADRYFDEVYFRYLPSQATAAGFHRFDGALEDLSQAAVTARAAATERFLAEVRAFPAARLSAPARIDMELLAAHLEGVLFELRELRMWARNPDVYGSTISYGAYTLITRSFAPAADRLRAWLSRAKEVPRLLAAARENLRAPEVPRIYVQIALEQLPGIARFFEQDVPAAFRDVTEPALVAALRASNAAVVGALRAYESWLKEALLPRAGGDFRLGAERYRKKLWLDELVDTPLDRLLEIGYADLRRNQARFRAAAATLDAKRTPQEIQAELEKRYPPPASLLEVTRAKLRDIRRFIEEKRLVTIPSTVEPRVEETPPFLRALTFASMDTPGAYETRATEAYFHITLPEKGWSAQQVAEHMAGFNHGMLLSTAIHEAYPGHYTQFLWANRARSKIRKLLAANTNAEGWAHYTEDMMFDAGYGGGDPRLRLGQLLDALLRNARFIVGVELHTGRRTYEEGIDFFVKEGFQTRANGERETKRGTSDPTYLYYTLGKLQILKLREDYRQKMGPRFTLGDFHDRFLAEGAPPIKLVRRALLGADGSPL